MKIRIPTIFFQFSIMENYKINNIFDFMDCIRDYEPNLVRYIMDFVFIPCREDKEGKHKYISAIPEKGSSSIIRNERVKFS